MDRNAIESKLRGIFQEQLGVLGGEIKTTDTLRGDLDADSFDVVELLMAAEDEFDIEIADEDAEKVKTFGDVVELVARAVAQKGAA